MAAAVNLLFALGRLHQWLDCHDLRQCSTLGLRPSDGLTAAYHQIICGSQPVVPKKVNFLRAQGASSTKLVALL
jgi:hypothetical protein